jgi:uncharacterized protein (TIGR02145 family)
MKTTRFLSWAAAGMMAAAAGLVGCGDAEQPEAPATEATLLVDKTSIAAAIAEGSYTIAVTSDSAWTAAVSATWCTLSPSSGSGSDTVTVSVAENLDTAPRSALITLTSGTREKEITVNQAASERWRENFTADADSIGNRKPITDGISGTITSTGGSDYRVRSMGGTWWMIQNANKEVSGCTYNTVDRGQYGRLYSWNCASAACPPGWNLPVDDDFNALSSWLTSNDKWSEWSSGFSLAGFGYDGSYGGYQGAYGYWWNGRISLRNWYVESGSAKGTTYATTDHSEFSVRCCKVQ